MTFLTRLRSTCLGLALACAALPALAQPVQWNYTFVNGVATATYSGNVSIAGACVGCGSGSVTASGSPVAGQLGVFTTPTNLTGLTIGAGLTVVGSVLSANAGAARPLLTAPQTFFVATTGNDANDCLTAPTACLTVQGAIVRASAFDLGGQNVTISVAAGTYAGRVLLNGPLVGQFSAAQLAIVGDVVTPANVVFSNNTAGGGVVGAFYNSMLSIRGVRFAAAGQVPTDILATDSGQVELQQCEFATANIHLYARAGGMITATGGYVINGPATNHARSEFSGRISWNSQTITVTGTPGIVTFVNAPYAGMVEAIGATFSGAATGNRYTAAGNSVINTNGGGANVFPGSVAGTTATGAQYL